MCSSKKFSNKRVNFSQVTPYPSPTKLVHLSPHIQLHTTEIKGMRESNKGNTFQVLVRVYTIVGTEVEENAQSDHMYEFLLYNIIWNHECW